MVDPVLTDLDFQIDELEDVASPGWGGWWAGFAAGVVVGAGVAIGVAVAT